MPPARTQVACPNCRMPVTTMVEQVFDVAQDASARQRFLSGRFNMIDCPNCHYQGQMSTPLLYHDPDKELLLSFVPMELGLPQMEQEKLLGRLMNEVINKLPQEKRKAYLLNPKPALTLQGMVERVLEAEGVTREMLDAQKAKVQLLQTLLAASDEQLPELIRQNDAQVDSVLLQMLSASAEATASSGNQAGAQKMATLQASLLEHSTFGQQVLKRQETLQTVGQELQKLGRQLTPDKLLELVISAAGDEDRLAAYVSYARPGMDYAFFEALTRRVDRAEGAEKERLAQARDRLLELTQQVDRAAQAQLEEATNLLRTLMEAPDPRQAVLDHLPEIDDAFLSVLNVNLEAAQRAKRQDVAERLMRVSDAVTAVMQEAAPPELHFINELLQIEPAEAAEVELRRRSAEINHDLVETMGYLGENLRQNGQAALADRLDKLRSVAVGELMKANWQK